ncbi:MAG: DUF4332 domain-containing protein [Caulobacterales bacterium]
MSVFFDLVLNTVCRSNHHRLAIDALAQMKGPNAAQWRDLFLQQHPAFLEGAKAPDEVFKDFKNHVLHVREGYWGGACEAAEEWYKRTVRALKDKDWKYGVYCAGVMSHYIVDPLQPFHTGQTEEEGLIHRAVEWSLSKSYMDLRKILLVDLGGWPEVRVEDGQNWLMRAVRAGADKSNPHYDTLISHYNFDLGRKKPEAGLDQEIKDKIAPLIGHAVVLLARVFERAFAEAAVMPPRVNLAVDTLLTTLNVPVTMIAKGIQNEQDRAIVTAMYQEFRKTGKVRNNLPEDDKDVRALYAHEVLKAPLSSLDCKWPAETGLAHGQGAPARKTRGRAQKVQPPKEGIAKRTPAERADDKRDAKRQAKEQAIADKRAAAQAKIDAKANAIRGASSSKEQARADAIAAKEKARADAIAAKQKIKQDAINAHAMKEKAKADAAKAALDAKAKAIRDAADAKANKGKSKEEMRKAAMEATVAQAIDDAKKAERVQAELPVVNNGKRVRLRAEDSVVDAPSIGRKTADRLQAVSVRTVGDLLKLDPEDGARRIKAGHINAKVIRDWQAQARFACTIPDVNSVNAQLLTGCGISDVSALANADAPKLHAEMVKFSNTEEGVRLLRSSRPPEVSMIATWVNAARGANKRAAA